MAQLTDAAAETIQKALEEAKTIGHALAEPAHLAIALLESDFGKSLSRRAELSVEEQRALTRSMHELATTKYPAQSPPPLSSSPSNATQRLVERASAAAKKQGDSLVAQDHLFLALYGQREVAQAFENHNLVQRKAEKAAKDLRAGRKIDSRSAEETYDALEKYGVDLVKLAAEGKIDPVIGRDDEVRRCVQILSRRTKNNPILVGPPGVGKTAVAEALALRIADYDVPEGMRGVGLRTLDMASLVAGAKYRGEFEERLKAVLQEVKEAPEPGLLLFIDEIHLVLGAGKSDGAMDAANILKPMLARGQLRMIGATTDDEYREHVEKDAAFERRFQKVLVTEPSVEATVAILRGLREKYEAHHGVRILDSSLVAAAQLSARYISGRFLPDKAIDLIDEASASRRVQLDSKPEELDMLERKIAALEIEAISLKREKDEGSQARLHEVKKKIANLKEKLLPLQERWSRDRSRADDLKALQEKLDRLKNKAVVARRQGDLERAADLEYGAIPETEKQLKSIKDDLEKLELERRESSSMQIDGTDGRPTSLVSESVTPDHISEVVSRWTGIPVTKLTQSERTRLLDLASRLKLRVVGQDAAIDAVANAIMRSRAGLAKPDAPLGAFLFVGPTGSGKTETCKGLAAELFDDAKSALVRIDMSEYSEAHSVSRLIGAPPGYIGYDRGGQLTEAVRKTPHVVVLLDEIEKAHQSVVKVLLQLLDEGRMTDGQGRTVNFTHAVVILTSNVGSDILLAAGPQTGDKVKTAVSHALRVAFPPEFLNRLTTCLFNPLGRVELRRVAHKAVATVASRLEEKGIDLKLSEDAAEVIVQNSYDPAFGARPIERFIETAITNKLSQMLLNGALVQGSQVIINVSPLNPTDLSFNVFPSSGR